MSRRVLTIATLALLAGVLALELSGIAPGAGRQVLPFLILLAAAILLWRAVWPERAARAADALSVPLEGAARARLGVTFGAGAFHLGAGAPDGVLLTASLQGAARHRVHREDGLAFVALDQPLTLARRRADWHLALSLEVAWEALEVRLGAADARLDLRALQPDSVVIEAGGTTLEALLPADGDVTVQIGGGQTTLRVPADAAAEIVSEIRLGAVEVDPARFVADADGMRWTARGTVPGAAVLHVTLKGGLGTVRVVTVAPESPAE